MPGASDTYQLARRTAPAALGLVALEATAAAALALVPPLAARAAPHGAPWLGPTLGFLVAGAALVVLASSRRAALVVVAAAVAALALGVGVGALPASGGASALAGLGLAFAAPLLVGEVLAAGAYIARGGERLAAALALGGAALTTCAAAFLVERWAVGVEVTALALGLGGVGAQAQLALARIGEARAALTSRDAFEVAAARFGGVPRALALAALGRSGPQGEP